MDLCAANRQHLAKSFRDYRSVFTALGDENRQGIFLVLLENEKTGMRIPEITEKTHLSRPAVSHHLQILKNAGLVSMHRVGAKNYYYVNANEPCWRGLKELIDQVDTVVSVAAQTGYPGWEEK